MKIFCMPYAGAKSSIFYKYWNSYFEEKYEIIPVELSGRGLRADELSHANMNEIISDILDLIKKSRRHKEDYVIFAYSTGSILAYELSKKILEDRHIESPRHIFLSSEKPLHIKRDHFEDGLSDEFCPELFKKDYEIFNCSKLTEIKALDIPLTVFANKTKEFELSEFVQWRKYTCKECNIKFFKGDIIFQRETLKSMIRYIEKTLKEMK